MLTALFFYTFMFCLIAWLITALRNQYHIARHQNQALIYDNNNQSNTVDNKNRQKMISVDNDSDNYISNRKMRKVSFSSSQSQSPKFKNKNIQRQFEQQQNQRELPLQSNESENDNNDNIDGNKEQLLKYVGHNPSDGYYQEIFVNNNNESHSPREKINSGQYEDDGHGSSTLNAVTSNQNYQNRYLNNNTMTVVPELSDEYRPSQREPSCNHLLSHEPQLQNWKSDHLQKSVKQYSQNIHTKNNDNDHKSQPMSVQADRLNTPPEYQNKTQQLSDRDRDNVANIRQIQSQKKHKKQTSSQKFLEGQIQDYDRKYSQIKDQQSKAEDLTIEDNNANKKNMNGQQFQQKQANSMTDKQKQNNIVINIEIQANTLKQSLQKQTNKQQQIKQKILQSQNSQQKLIIDKIHPQSQQSKCITFDPQQQSDQKNIPLILVHKTFKQVAKSDNNNNNSVEYIENQQKYKEKQRRNIFNRSQSLKQPVNNNNGNLSIQEINLPNNKSASIYSSQQSQNSIQIQRKDLIKLFDQIDSFFKNNSNGSGKSQKNGDNNSNKNQQADQLLTSNFQLISEDYYYSGNKSGAKSEIGDHANITKFNKGNLHRQKTNTQGRIDINEVRKHQASMKGQSVLNLSSRKDTISNENKLSQKSPDQLPLQSEENRTINNQNSQNLLAKPPIQKKKKKKQKPQSKTQKFAIKKGMGDDEQVQASEIQQSGYSYQQEVEPNIQCNKGKEDVIQQLEIRIKKLISTAQFNQNKYEDVNKQIIIQKQKSNNLQRRCKELESQLFEKQLQKANQNQERELGKAQNNSEQINIADTSNKQFSNKQSNRQSQKLSEIQWLEDQLRKKQQIIEQLSKQKVKLQRSKKQLTEILEGEKKRVQQLGELIQKNVIEIERLKGIEPRQYEEEQYDQNSPSQYLSSNIEGSGSYKQAKITQIKKSFKTNAKRKSQSNLLIGPNNSMLQIAAQINKLEQQNRKISEQAKNNEQKYKELEIENQKLKQQLQKKNKQFLSRDSQVSKLNSSEEQQKQKNKLKNLYKQFQENNQSLTAELQFCQNQISQMLLTENQQKQEIQKLKKMLKQKTDIINNQIQQIKSIMNVQPVNNTHINHIRKQTIRSPVSRQREYEDIKKRYNQIKMERQKAHISLIEDIKTRKPIIRPTATSKNKHLLLNEQEDNQIYKNQQYFKLNSRNRYRKEYPSFKRFLSDGEQQYNIGSQKRIVHERKPDFSDQILMNSNITSPKSQKNILSRPYQFSINSKRSDNNIVRNSRYFGESRSNKSLHTIKLHSSFLSWQCNPSTNFLASTLFDNHINVRHSYKIYSSFDHKSYLNKQQFKQCLSNVENILILCKTRPFYGNQDGKILGAFSKLPLAYNRLIANNQAKINKGLNQFPLGLLLDLQNFTVQRNKPSTQKSTATLSNNILVWGYNQFMIDLDTPNLLCVNYNSDTRANNNIYWRAIEQVQAFIDNQLNFQSREKHALWAQIEGFQIFVLSCS